MYVCICKGVTVSDVKWAARGGSITAEALIAALGLRDPECCGRCAEEMDEIVAIATRADGPADPHLPHPVRHSLGHEQHRPS